MLISRSVRPDEYYFLRLFEHGSMLFTSAIQLTSESFKGLKQEHGDNNSLCCCSLSNQIISVNQGELTQSELGCVGGGRVHGPVLMHM